MTTILVVGASGATGRLLVQQLLDRGLKVKAIARPTASLPDAIKQHENLSVIHANIHAVTPPDMALFVRGCDAVISCLGHNLTFKGIFGKPRLLVTESVRRLCQAIEEDRSAETVASDFKSPVKFILMNTTGNSNRDIPEKVSFGQQCVMLLLRLLLPPHVDNEKAADFLRTNIGQNNKDIEWTAVRPDGLLDEQRVTDYKVYPSPTRSAIFDAGVTSRINVGHFMADLVSRDDLWQRWKGKMPVIYNNEQPSKI